MKRKRKDKAMIDKAVPCLASRGAEVSAVAERHLVQPPGEPLEVHSGAQSFLLLMKVSSQLQRIELYPRHTSHCSYEVMLLIVSNRT